MSHNPNLKAPSRSKINARHGIVTGQPDGNTFKVHPGDIGRGNSDAGSKVKARTGVMTAEPNGTTWEKPEQRQAQHWPVHMKQPDGSKWGNTQKKKADRFGVTDSNPSGVTFEAPQKALFDLPKASEAPLKGIKTITETTGLYVPAKNGPVNAIQNVPTGKGAPKKGRTDKGAENNFAPSRG